MKHTPQNVLRILARSGRHGLTERQLRVLRADHLLPVLQRATKAGTNEPEYVWVERDIVKRVALLHDLLAAGYTRHAELEYVLWLLGYPVSWEHVRQWFLQRYGGVLSGVVHEHTDDVELADFLSSIVFRWKYAPHRTELARDYGSATFVRIAELGLNFIANLEYELDEETLSSMFSCLTGVRELLEDQLGGGHRSVTELLPVAQQKLAYLQSLVAFPVLRSAMMQADEEEWAWVLKGFQTGMEALACFLRLAARVKPIPELPMWFYLNILIGLASLAIPVGLSLRCNGFGAWIEAALLRLQEGTGDTDFQDDMVGWMAEHGRRSVAVDADQTA